MTRTFWDIARDYLSALLAFDEQHPLLFTQSYFWVFFAMVFLIFAAFRNRCLLRNAFLFCCSVFFYYKTSGLFTLILLFVTGYDFFAARWMERQRTDGGRRAVLVLSIIVNLLTLCYFKYAYFITDLLNRLFGLQLAVFDVFSWAGNVLTGTRRFRVDDILLPVGISFYTFQAISYMMDVYRRRVKPLGNLLDFGFYVSFFPQLVAGPIVRAQDFVPQLHKPYFLSRRHFGMAVFWIMNGLVKKIVLSDYIAVNFVDRVFENPLLYTGFENLTSLFGYSLQVYVDFSGYTDIAIGVAMLMGFWLPKNFHSPYKAQHPGEFWKRWHISLSRWLQDYLYISLGGNRHATPGTFIIIAAVAFIASFLSGSLWVPLVLASLALVVGAVAFFRPDKRKKITTNINSLDTMLLGGLWHGASWNFMIWGGLNGIGMIVYKFWKDWTLPVRTLVMCCVTGTLQWLRVSRPHPVFEVFFVWMLVILCGNVIRLLYHWSGARARFDWLRKAWAIFQTFVFITFTRLFFRAGSNLNPSEANETAWRTAQHMMHQMGSAWNTASIPEMVHHYRAVLALIVFGMVVHWLPDRFKRRYRLWFAAMPLPLMVLAVVLLVFVMCQFITSDLQSFIYFQF